MLATRSDSRLVISSFSLTPTARAVQTNSQSFSEAQELESGSVNRASTPALGTDAEHRTTGFYRADTCHRSGISV